MEPVYHQTILSSYGWTKPRKLQAPLEYLEREAGAINLQRGVKSLSPLIHHLRLRCVLQKHPQEINLIKKPQEQIQQPTQMMTRLITRSVSTMRIQDLQTQLVPSTNDDGLSPLTDPTLAS